MPLGMAVTGCDWSGDTERVVLNVGGERYMTYWSTLRTLPHTRLAKLSPDDPSYDADQGEYFFDRNPHLFPYILDAYREGELHFPQCVCGPAVRQELAWWGLGEEILAPCCLQAVAEWEQTERTLDEISIAFCGGLDRERVGCRGPGGILGTRDIPSHGEFPENRGFPGHRGFPEKRGFPENREFPDNRGFPENRGFPANREFPENRESSKVTRCSINGNAEITRKPTKAEESPRKMETPETEDMSGQSECPMTEETLRMSGETPMIRETPGIKEHPQTPRKGMWASTFTSWKVNTWLFLEEPNSSTPAKVCNAFDVLNIFSP